MLNLGELGLETQIYSSLARKTREFQCRIGNFNSWAREN